MMNDIRVYEVKIFDRSGKLKKVVSQKSLIKRSDEKFKAGSAPLRNYKNKNTKKLN
ncbi:MAG: hypothetical protein NPINA01_05130 [Nitrospinaceae bacterium]|nr:MAG: hypothetical protein NPINA01_05130 [Nitrospinaceae bacterium]